MTKKVSDADVAKATSLLTKARSRLLMVQPFFGSLALRLKLTPILDEGVCDTAATDGKHLYYYPPFINSLPMGQSNAKVIGLVAHEVMHCVFQHMTRRSHRDMNDWNIACDYVINTHLIDNGFILPDEGIIDKDGKYKGWSAEAVYSEIHKDKPEGEKPTACPWGGVLDGQDASGQKAEWEIAVRAAATIAKNAGKLPGGFEGLIEELLEPRVNWRELLWNVASRIDRSEYSWSRPNRAYISEDEYLPSLRNEALGEIIFIFDTSGSVSDQATQQFWTEGVDVAKHLRPSKLVVIQADAKVQKVDEIDPDNLGELKMEVRGRGGTTFVPAIAYAKENYPDAEMIVYLTDMFGDYGEDPGVPFLWLSITKKGYQDPPFGEVAYMPLDEDEE